MNFSSFKQHNKAPLHAQISAWMIGQFAAYALDEQLPTDRSLAAGLGVSTLTVQRAMSELERQGYVYRQQGRGTFLTSRERRVHNPLEESSGKGDVILAYPSYFSYDYWARAHLAETAALKAGYRLTEFKINPATTHEALVDLVKCMPNPQAVFISPVPCSIDRDYFRALDALGIPVVIFSHCEHVPLGSHVYSVVPDWFKSGYLRAELLIKQGHRSIAWLANEPAGQDDGLGVKGARQCLRDYDISSRNLRVLRSTTQTWEDSTMAAYRLCKQLVDEHEVTAIITDSIAGAVGSQHYLWKQGLSVPEDMSIVSGGGAMPVERFLSPPISAITSSREDEVRKAFSIVEAPPQGTRVLQAEVIEEAGRSIAPPKSKQTDPNTKGESAWTRSDKH